MPLLVNTVSISSEPFDVNLSVCYRSDCVYIPVVVVGVVVVVVVVVSVVIAFCFPA